MEYASFCILFYKKYICKLGMVAVIYNFSTLEAKAGGS